MNEGWAVYWHSRIMNEHVMKASEVVDYCEHYSGVLAMSKKNLNPYKIGLELFRYIQHRWDTGKFGKDWVECDDPAIRASWHKETNLGMQKIFEVRKHYNDITFIDEFLDEDFCEIAQIFTWERDPRTGKALVNSKEFKDVKSMLLEQLTNFGQPVIEVVDGNFHNRSELLLSHKHEGRDLKLDWAFETLKNLYKIWKKPVHLYTVQEKETRLLSFDGINTQVGKWP